MQVSTLRALVQTLRQGNAAALVTSLSDHAQIMFSDDLVGHDDSLSVAVLESWRKGCSRVVEIDGHRQFILIAEQPLKLHIVGAVHIAQVLIPVAQACGYEVTLIDPRQAFASSERFPNVALKNEWPDKALLELGLDVRTAVVTLTHDPKLDEPALVQALSSEAFYIGALGSRRTHQARCQRLIKAHVSQVDLARIHAPVGLDIGAESPAEIAISIIAEMTQSLRTRSKQ